MTRIAKKRRSVKRRNASKPAKTRLSAKPRYTIRKDSLDRRYAVDKRTGQRVSLYKAEKERKQRQKIIQSVRPIPRHKTPKTAKSSKKRSLAAKKGWATRKAQALARSEAAKKGWAKRKKPETVELVPISVLTPPERLPPLLPPGVLIVPLHEGVKDRIDRYPKVRQAAEDAFTRLQIEAWNKRGDRLAGKPMPVLTREDRIKSNIRDLIAERITDFADIDRVIDQLYDELDEEFSMRELYELYFSPDVA